MSPNPVLDGSFTNETHHPALHFCTRSYNAVRFNRHCRYASALQAATLLTGPIAVERMVPA